MDRKFMKLLNVTVILCLGIFPKQRKLCQSLFILQILKDKCNISKFADDQAMSASTQERLQRTMDALRTTSGAHRMRG